jgi:hypothetical protein
VRQSRADILSSFSRPFETALGAVDQTAPTQEQVDAAKAAAKDVKTAYGTVQTQLGCPAATQQASAATPAR